MEQGKKYTLVLGAGASRDFGFPTGLQLKQILLGTLPKGFEMLEEVSRQTAIKRAHWNEFMEDAVCDQLNHPSGHLKAFQILFEATDLDSIDSYIQKHNQHSDIAKFLVALTLLLCERANPKPRGSWYTTLWNQILKPAYELAQPPINIITFNYDRSLERYLHCVSKATFGDRAQSVFEHAPIVHVYGSLGPATPTGMEYGDFRKTRESASNIRLIEPREESETKLDEIILEADTLVFLGFGFDETNLRRLGIHAMRRPKEIFASCLNLPMPAIKRANDMLGKIDWGVDTWTVDTFIKKSLAFA